MNRQADITMTIIGLSLGLAGVLAGVYLSDMVPATPAIYGLICALWCAVSASLIAGRYHRLAQIKAASRMSHKPSDSNSR